MPAARATLSLYSGHTLAALADLRGVPALSSGASRRSRSPGAI